MRYDVVIIGGGPAGLSAALTLGRARKSVLVCDAGPPRNAAAEHINGFVTRDHIVPAEFRRLGREQLIPYPKVEYRPARVESLSGATGQFAVGLAEGSAVEARRILLAGGMIDTPLAIEGYRDLWGHGIWQCPYCHGWEAQDGAFGFIPPSVEMLDFALLLRGWSQDVTVFTHGQFEVPSAARARLATGGVRLEERRIARLSSRATRLDTVTFSDAAHVSCDTLFVQPRQQQTALVLSLDLALNPAGYVAVDPMHRETSRKGIYAAGDLTTQAQAAVVAAAEGMFTAAMLNHGLTVELALEGALGAVAL